MSTFFELREYRTLAGKRDEWVRFMDETIIPFQASKGMTIVASYVGAEEDDLYVWIRRFNSEEERATLYAAVYETDFWKNDVSPQVGNFLDRTRTVVRRITPTPNSVLR